GRAKTQLRDKWNIIVSVRTYDALKSRDLENIFRKTSTNNNFQFYIHELSNIEVKNTLKVNDDLLTSYQKSSNELKVVLRIPFFLKIFIDIVKKTLDSNFTEMQEIHSEIQLLEKYWEDTIDNSDYYLEKELFLTKFTTALVE